MNRLLNLLGATPPHPSPSPPGPKGPSGLQHAGVAAAERGLFDAFTWAQGAQLIAACIAVLGVAITVLTTSSRARRERLANVYADALEHVSAYLEGPYRIRRKDGTSATRFAVTSRLSDVKTAIDHSQALLRLHASRSVADAYDAYVSAAKREAGKQMNAAWDAPAVQEDSQVNLHFPFPRDESDAARQKVLVEMQMELARRGILFHPMVAMRRRQAHRRMNPPGGGA